MAKLRLSFTKRIVAVSGISLGIFAISLLYVIRSVVKRAVYKETSLRVQVGQDTFWELILQKGTPSLVDGKLQLGVWVANGDHSLVDHLKRLTGADATLFQVQDGKPTRVTTTIFKLDGSERNVGTELSGPARAAYERGGSFVGTTAVAGREFVVRYDPLCDIDGHIIGAYYSGIPLTAMDAAAKDIMRVVITGTAMALLPSLTVLYLITRPVGRTFLRAVSVAQGLALGDVDQSTDDSWLHDELGDVNAAFRMMISYQQRMASIADAIARGDLSNDVSPASNVDRLGNAFLQMTLNLRALVGRLETSALTDNLTQLGNRRAFNEKIASELSRTARRGGVLALAVVDIDEFKAVNDRHGHQEGDAVLAKLSAILKVVRLEDAAFRLGGDEFALIMPDTSGFDATVLLERIRGAAEAQLSGATISVGIAVSPQGLVDAHALQHQADKALYCGKQGGRNAVVLYDNTMAQASRAHNGAESERA